MAFRVRALQKGELDGLLLCFQDAFEVDDPSISIVRNSLVNDPYFHPERVRVGLLDGRIVSHVVILHRAVFVGNHIISVAGITAVATHPAYQRQGFGTRVMQDALRLVKNQGYDMAMLTTRVPQFFARLGFREVPKVDGFECPARALARLETGTRYSVSQLDFARDWRSLLAVYRQYSQGLTGLQVRDGRFWETWPRRGTFPQGFSSRLGAIGLLAEVEGKIVAYLVGYTSPEQAHLTVTDLAHVRGHEAGALKLLRQAAEGYLSVGSGRVVLHVGGNAPILAHLRAADVPLEVEVGPGLMVLIPNREWIGPAGFRNTDDAIEHLFRSEPPILWQRDGY
ncbi:MAG: GNAT family N-acetyltransferase [Armatimonadetes bacterium]|nr:GNAT family N-acetyltransferase [Armatimonadota bacterium]